VQRRCMTDHSDHSPGDLPPSETSTALNPSAATTAGGGGTAAPRPATLGHYRIIRILGEGGMGTVFEAEQEQPRRTVALKVIKAGFISRELLRRFEQESLAL